ncbi:MAG: hypothetical protein ABGX16_00895 [Pirellulales bacterium]
MALVIQIVLAVVVLLALVATWLSTKNWHWGQVVLALGLFLTATGYAILAADTMRIHRNLRSNIAKNQTELANLQSRIGALQRGTNDESLKRKALPAESPQLEMTAEDVAGTMPGINELTHRMHLLTRLRGKVWRGVQPAGAPGENGQVEVTISAPTPHGLAKDSILYVFEAGNPMASNPLEGRQYLGEFRVQGDTDGGVVLVPIHTLDPLAGERLSRSEGPWNLHESMPIDQHELFASLTEEQLRHWLPEATVEEYIRDGTPATVDDDPWHIAWFDDEGNRVGPEATNQQEHTSKYDRPLRDYAPLISELARVQVERIAAAKALTADNKKLQAALASAKELGQLHVQQQQVLSQDLAGMRADRAAIEALLTQIQHLLAQATTALDHKLASNIRLANQYVAEQMALKGQIDQLAPASSSEPLLQGP